MAKSLIDSGIPTKSISFYGKRNRLVDVNMDILKKDTAYPFSVLISQRHVEILLEEKLTETGLSVIRGKAVTGYNYDVDHRNVNVTFEDGSSIRTRYLIGTDGAHSVVCLLLPPCELKFILSLRFEPTLPFPSPIHTLKFPTIVLHLQTLSTLPSQMSI